MAIQEAYATILKTRGFRHKPNDLRDAGLFDSKNCTIIMKTTARILIREIVVFTGEILAKLLYEGQMAEADLLGIIADIESRHTEIEYFINEKYLGYSILSLALIRKCKKICAKIMMHQMTVDQFCENFKSTEASDISDSFPVLLEFDLESLPPSIRPIVSELFLRKKLALITSMEGPSQLSGISWEMEGHHNYSDASKFFFESLSKNEASVLEKIKNGSLKLESDEKEVALKCLNETLSLIKNTLQRTSGLTGNICPFLAGTRSGQNLHAEGFVIYNNKYLFLYVERSNPRQSGIAGYKFEPGFVQTDSFNAFLEKVLKSTSGGIRNALDPETYETRTIYSGDLQKTELYIPMSLQNAKDCTTASSEGIFVATLFCHLLERGLTEKRAIELSKQCSEFFFRENKIAEIKKFLQHAIEKYPNESPTYQQELVLFVAAIREHAEKNKLSDDEVSALFKQFDDIRGTQATPLNQRLSNAQQALQSTTLEPDSSESAPLTPQRLAEVAQQPSSSSSPTEESHASPGASRQPLSTEPTEPVEQIPRMPPI